MSNPYQDDTTQLDEYALQYAHIQKYLGYHELNKLLQEASSYGYMEQDIIKHAIEKGYNK